MQATEIPEAEVKKKTSQAPPSPTNRFRRCDPTRVCLFPGRPETWSRREPAASPAGPPVHGIHHHVLRPAVEIRCEGNAMGQNPAYPPAIRFNPH